MTENEYRKPDLDQLACFAAVRTIGPGYTDREFQFIAAQLAGSETVRLGWERNHRELQASLGASRG